MRLLLIVLQHTCGNYANPNKHSPNTNYFMRLQ